MWWKLPAELVDQILQLVSVDDYVALTQTGSEVRHYLDTTRQFLVVLHANFSDDIESYEWKIDPGINKASLWADLGSLRRFLRSVETIYATPQIQASADVDFRNKRDDHIRQALRIFASSSKFFLPLISEMRDSLADLENSLNSIDTSPISISRISWIRKLLQLQNFLRTVDFFSTHGSDDVLHIEQCYFELSRCYIEFPELARSRMFKLREIRRTISSYLPIYSGIIKFQDEGTYRRFLGCITGIILSALSSENSSSGSGGNILRIYKGVSRESPELFLSIFVKIFEEEVFSKLTFVVAGKKKVNPSARLSQLFLILDGYFVVIHFEQGVYKIYDKDELSRLPSVSIAQSTALIRIGHVLLRAFDADEGESNSAADLYNQDWDNNFFNTSIIKLRFLRTILITILERKPLCTKSYRPLIQESDFFLYFYATMSFLGGPQTSVPSFQEHTSYGAEAQEDTEDFAKGDLIVSEPSDYFGVVLGVYPNVVDGDRFVSALPLDNIEKTVALNWSLKRLHSNLFGDSFSSFLRWLMTTDGMTYAGMFLFPKLCVTSEKLSLVFRSGESIK